jgi:hypothetical protein
MLVTSVDANYSAYQSEGLPVANTETDLPVPNRTSIKKPEQIFVQALSSNSEPIFIGQSGVTADGLNGGYELQAGASMYLPAHMQSRWKAICATGGMVLLVTYVSGVY